MNRLFLAKVKNGELLYEDLTQLKMWLWSNLEGKEVEVSVEKRDNKRSTKANRYYWAYLRLIEEETGNDANDLHEIAKRMFLTPVYIRAFGKEVKIPKSTTRLDKKAFSDYLTKISIWSGIVLPDPQEMNMNF